MPPNRNYRDAASLIRHRGRQLAYQLSCSLLPDSLQSHLIAKTLTDTGRRQSKLRKAGTQAQRLLEGVRSMDTGKDMASIHKEGSLNQQNEAQARKQMLVAEDTGMGHWDELDSSAVTGSF